MKRWHIIILGSVVWSLVAHPGGRASAQGSLACAVQINVNRTVQGKAAGDSTATGIVLQHEKGNYLVTAYHHILDSNHASIVVTSSRTILIGHSSYFIARTVGGV